MQTMNDSFISEVAVISWKPTPPQSLHICQTDVRMNIGPHSLSFTRLRLGPLMTKQDMVCICTNPWKVQPKSFCFIFSSRLEKNYCTIRRHYANGLYENASGHFTRTLLFHKINQYCFLALKDVISGKHQMAK